MQWYWSKGAIDLSEERVLSAFVRSEQMASSWQHLIQESIKLLLASSHFIVLNSKVLDTFLMFHKRVSMDKLRWVNLAIS